MKNILNKSFYNQPTTEIARQLLGKFLCREIDNKLYVGKIVETEAYLGAKDLACHSAKGLTERNKAMFGPAGHAYVYFIYGMYYCFNVVTEEKNNPCAVLVRALEPIKQSKNVILSLSKDLVKRKGLYYDDLRQAQRDNCKNYTNSLNGPAKLCREFEIDKKLNGWNLTLGKKLWIENGEIIKPDQIKKAKRVGVDYAGAWKNKLLRFYIKDNKFISKK